MRCPRCQNESKQYFYKGSKGWMCRRCVQFKRQLIQEEDQLREQKELREDCEEYMLKYTLTPAQTEISRKCAKAIECQDVYVEAICGAGKTEVVILSIAQALQRRQRVGFAIARRQVVLELRDRLSVIFHKAKVIAVCQGHTEEVMGDLIVCTTHQLYRYPNFFDLLILDEPDAFPYKGNKVLQGIVKSSCRGNMIYLTATADEELKKRISEKTIYHLQLYQRPHQHPLIVPKKVVGPWIILLAVGLFWIQSHKERQILVFVPTIRMTAVIKTMIKPWMKVTSCHSKTKNRDEIIAQFKRREWQCLVSTTILERGVTIERIHVCVFWANHSLFDEASLVQMSGRVGRSFHHPEGECLFLCSSQSESVDRCIFHCESANEKR